MHKLIQTYLDQHAAIKILDVGSFDVTKTPCQYYTPGPGSYKELCSCPSWSYQGLDVSEGPNVDIVAMSPYQWPIKNETYDVLISGQCLEHVEDTHLWIKEFYRVLKSGGLGLIIAPWQAGEHRYPVDCWRVFPDGMKYLATKIGGFSILECTRNDICDTWCVVKK